MDLWDYILRALAGLFARGANVDEPAAWFLVTVFLLALLLFVVIVGVAWAVEDGRRRARERKDK